ncbi:MAG: DUF4383 domain-containing protein [Ktedonobacterales bacterium]|nr:DUF4383 domain-containing protein [Ktedonobacterales bacterium]
MSNLAKTYAQLLGGVLTLVGVLGFVAPLAPTAASAPHGALLGIFAIDPIHNVIHLASGIVGLLAANMAGGQYARLYAGVFGAVYAVVTIVGFIQGNTVLNLIDVNVADNFLHTAIAAASLAVYFLAGNNNAAATRTA